MRCKLRRGRMVVHRLLLVALVCELWQIPVKSIHLLFILIVVVENEPEGNTSSEGEACNSGVHPQDLRIDEDGNKSFVERGAEGVREEIQALHERLHAGWGFGIGIFETGDGDEDLGDADEEVCRGLDGDVDIVWQLRAVGCNASFAVERRIKAWSGLIDEALYASGVGKREGCENEADGNAHHWLQLISAAAHEWVDKAVKNWDEDQDGDWIEVLHLVVWHAMALHLSSLSNEVGRELAVAHPEYWVEYEDLAGTEGTVELVDEVVVPWNRAGSVVLRTPRWFGRLGVPGFDHHADSLEGVGDDGALRWAHYVRLPAQDKGCNTNIEHAEAHQVSSPETLVFLHKWSGQKRQTSKIDAPIEDHIDSLEGDGRVDDGPLTAPLDLDSHLVALVLICDQRRNIGFDATRPETDDHDSCYIATERMAIVKRNRESGGPQNKQAYPIDSAEDDNRLVAAEILISDDGAENWSDCAGYIRKKARDARGSLEHTVAEPLEEKVETGGSLHTKTNAYSAIGAVCGVENVVLEETLAAVVGEALAQFDNGNQEGRCG